MQLFAEDQVVGCVHDATRPIGSRASVIVIVWTIKYDVAVPTHDQSRSWCSSEFCRHLVSVRLVKHEITISSHLDTNDILVSRSG